ncbi:FAD-dependent 5-carboxymethylaminomethyl-2-thiouridine(34) oxidoreductase MnmC [Brevundimonas sp. NIBR11]|uniref:FAD-dependent 5-carboxymethylaminomethyl-2-thiouridine(34) oxidoreductase MnmC n=1 Tax=Brevundimonas sp. NIBR11 TaxID=3015999 RepID=UPI0022F08357|nr:FAD-dependent 5-carboxymethylaminomethyl-2-thiouridine(34) oxidoreductase MnmC [Brevundimonas sp. NIBR11]WGM29988.1 tRNA 5-methylaminomethyl-2-thiouridine biosynthesis bifunctional protein MnmC [Brevundimonas sp. NIBR11]
MSETEDRNPQLVWTEAGEPRSGRYGDVYFSAQDGLAESRTVFLAGCGLPEAWAGRRDFTVAELGFGSGLNIAALLDLWRRHRPEGGRLHVFSIEGYPLSREEARRAMSAWPEIAEATKALVERWPSGTPGFHRIDLPEFGAVLDLAVGEVDWALDQWTGRADAWFLDGFAPSVNPDMWSDAVFDRIAARSAPDARVATFTVAGVVRRGLSERGFAVDKRPGHGRKRERLEARGTGALGVVAPPRCVAVVGAGVAGAATMRALTAAGLTPVLIEATATGSGASGFPAALVTPRFDLGDDSIAALFAQALERADALYSPVPGAVIARGVLQLSGTERDARRFERIAAQPIWSGGAVIATGEAEASRIVGEPISGPGLAMAAAFTVAPAAIMSAWIDPAALRTGKAAHLEPTDDGWRVLDASGSVLAEADAVVICAGAGTSVLAPDLSLSPVRGQAEWVETATSPGAIAWGGYVAPTGAGFLFGATHDRADPGTEVRPADTDRNIAALAARLPQRTGTITREAVRSRAATRATTRDRLPIAGPLPDRPGLFVLGGLGSRGFCLAPLLGEHVAALIAGKPSPLPAAVAERITPSRAALAPDARQEDACGV